MASTRADFIWEEPRLGAGSFGEVHRVRRRADGVTYVIKTISAALSRADQEASLNEVRLLALVVLWCGVVVNAIASFLQVGGQQAIGPARAQVLYAPTAAYSQPRALRRFHSYDTLSVKRHKRRRTKSACREG